MSGPVGIGLRTIATDVAVKLAGSAEFVSHILPEKTGITIEQVRTLYTQTRSKAAGPRVLLLHDVELMTHPAQNAFLKLLEEPPERTHFILVSHNHEAVLPTILSRVQSIELMPIGANESKALLAEYQLPDAVKAQIGFIANGLPAEMIKLASDESYREKVFINASEAKRFLGGGRLERLLLASKVSSDRSAAIELLNVASRMAAYNLSNRVDMRSVDFIDSMQSAIDAIRANGNVKAQLLKVCLQ
jgi:DNA polymerase-3 subunit delta'